MSETRGLRGCRTWLCLLVRGLRDRELLCGNPLPWWCCAASSLPPAPLLWGEGDSKSRGLSLICSPTAPALSLLAPSQLCSLLCVPIHSPTKMSPTARGTTCIAQCCVGKAFWGCTQCAGPGSRRRWYLLALRNLPAGRAVLGGGLFAASPRPRGSLPCGFCLLTALRKGILKAQLSCRASPPPCHSLSVFCLQARAHPATPATCKLVILAHLWVCSPQSCSGSAGRQSLE